MPHGTNNDAIASQPTVEQEMAKFKTVSFKDGEIHSGKSKDGATEDAAREAAAGRVNNRSHQENQEAGETSNTDDKSGEAEAGKGKEAAPIELSDAESAAAIEKAEKAEGGELTDDEKAAVLAAALADKQKGVAREARKAAKAARFNDNYRAARAAERRADAAERERDNLLRRLERLEAKANGEDLTGDKDKGKKAATGAPDPKDSKYEYGELDPKYLADLSRWQTEAVLAERDEKAKTTKQTEADAEAAEVFKERVEAFAEAGSDEFDDFQEVVMDTLNLPESDPDAWPLSATMGELILESDHGRAIAYDLASDPKEARRIFRMSEARQAIWFGQQEAKLSAGSAASDKDKGKESAAAAAAGRSSESQARESKAPPPPKFKVTGAGGNRAPNSATTDFAAFEAQAMAPARK